MSQKTPETVDDIFANEGAVATVESRPQGNGFMPTEVAKARIRKPVEKVAPSPPSHSVIAGDVTFKGTMTSRGEITIEGQFQGTITGNAVTIGEHGMVLGDVLAEQVNVLGRVKGVLCCTKVTLGAKSHIVGDIHYRLLLIKEGARFEGQSCYSEEPKALDHASREAREQAAAALSMNTNDPVRHRRSAA